MRTRALPFFVLAAASAHAQSPDTLGPRLPQVLERVAPVLPDISTADGRVALTAIVDSTGSLLRLRVTTPLRPDADSAAVAAVRQWRFAPAYNESGRAVAGMLRIALVFEPRLRRPSLPEWVAAFESLPYLVFPVSLGNPASRREWFSTAEGCREVEMPVKRSGSNPEYPPAMRQNRRNGRVLVATRLDERGRVAEVQVTEHDDPDFEEASVRAVRTWRFSPATCDGQPVSSGMLIPIRFYTSGAGVQF